MADRTPEYVREYARTLAEAVGTHLADEPARAGPARSSARFPGPAAPSGRRWHLQVIEHDDQRFAIHGLPASREERTSLVVRLIEILRAVQSADDTEGEGLGLH